MKFYVTLHRVYCKSAYNMSKLNTEFFIARRISSASNAESRNVMVRIASFTVAIGVAVMIISMAVISGFKSQLTDKLIGFGSHIQIVSLDDNNSLETKPIYRVPELLSALLRLDNVESINAYAVKGGIIKTDSAMQGVMLKGVEAGYDSSFFASSLQQGRLPNVHAENRIKEILISRSLANMMRLSSDDKVEMLFIGGSDRPSRRDRFKVSGIYETGYQELDDMVVLTDIRNVQRLNGWQAEQVTGYEVTAENFAQLDKLDRDVYETIIADTTVDEPLMSLNIRERFPMLFDWLQAHDVNAAVIIIIMLMVSLLNMISALLIILFERTTMIGVLKSLGMDNRALQKVFIIRSSFIVLKGMVWGNVIGIGLSLIQLYTNVIKLDQTGYFLTSVPIKFDVWWLMAINLGTLVIIIGILMIPAMMISAMKPDKTIRFQ